MIYMSIIIRFLNAQSASFDQNTKYIFLSFRHLRKGIRMIYVMIHFFDYVRQSEPLNLSAMLFVFIDSSFWNIKLTLIEYSII